MLEFEVAAILSLTTYFFFSFSSFLTEGDVCTVLKS